MSIAKRAGLDGRTAIVTGAAGGIGAAIAAALSEAGMRLAVCDRDHEGLSRLSQQLTRIIAILGEFDVRDEVSLQEFFSRIDDSGLRVDALVNVVGGTSLADFLETTPEKWKKLIDLNLTQVLHVTHAAATRMIDSNSGGSIVNITSIEAHRAAPGHAIYAAAKAGIEELSRSLAVELGPFGVRVNCVAPDYVTTEGTRAIEKEFGTPPIGPEEAASTVPLGRVASTVDVANAVLFLVSDLAAFITGSTLHPDGGSLIAGRWARIGEHWRPRLPHYLLM